MPTAGVLVLLGALVVVPWLLSRWWERAGVAVAPVPARTPGPRRLPEDHDAWLFAEVVTRRVDPPRRRRRGRAPRTCSRVSV